LFGLKYFVWIKSFTEAGLIRVQNVHVINDSSYQTSYKTLAYVIRRLQSCSPL